MDSNANATRRPTEQDPRYFIDKVIPGVLNVLRDFECYYDDTAACRQLPKNHRKIGEMLDRYVIEARWRVDEMRMAGNPAAGACERELDDVEQRIARAKGRMAAAIPARFEVGKLYRFGGNNAAFPAVFRCVGRTAKAATFSEVYFGDDRAPRFIGDDRAECNEDVYRAVHMLNTRRALKQDHMGNELALISEFWRGRFTSPPPACSRRRD